MSSRGLSSTIAVAAAISTFIFAAGAAADRGGVPNGGREDRPEPPPQAQPQGPPAAQQQPQPKAAPPGQERRPESAPKPRGQDVRTAPRPRRDAAPKPTRTPRPAPRPAGTPRNDEARGNAPGQQRARRAQAGGNDRGGDDDGDRGQGRTTICHSTGSGTNGFVEITVANPSLGAHGRHGDLIPAPAGGCPGGDSSSGRIDICHATGSETNPYVLLENMPQSSLNGHGDHEGDIIPAPAGGCPVEEQPAGTLTGDVPASALTPRSDGGSGSGGSDGGVLGLIDERHSADEVPASGVLTAVAEAPAQDSRPGATGRGSHGELPFTGLSLLLLAALGAAALAAGWSMHHHARARPTVS